VGEAELFTVTLNVSQQDISTTDGKKCTKIFIISALLNSEYDTRFFGLEGSLIVSRVFLHIIRR